MLEDILQITVAVPTQEGARQIAEALISQRLAASVWISAPHESIYWWQGKTEQAQEWALAIKTRQSLCAQVERTIKDLHPYKVPGILALPVVDGSQDYLEWLRTETGAADRSSTPSNSEESMVKEQLLLSFFEAHERLITAATAAFERGMTRQGEQWGPREILAHITGWEARAVARIPEIIAGTLPPPVKYDDDAFNAAIIAVLGTQSFEQVRETLRETYQQDMVLLRSLADCYFTPGQYVYERTRAAMQHACDHAHGLEQMV